MHGENTWIKFFKSVSVYYGLSGLVYTKMLVLFHIRIFCAIIAECRRFFSHALLYEKQYLNCKYKLVCVVIIIINLIICTGIKNILPIKIKFFYTLFDIWKSSVSKSFGRSCIKNFRFPSPINLIINLNMHKILKVSN